MEEALKTPKLLFSFVLDNSVSLSDERLAALMADFRAFASQALAYLALEWELTVFDGFAPFVAKSFADSAVAPIGSGRFPLLSRALDLAAARLSARMAELREAGEEVYRPSLFLLTDGFCVDSLEETVARLEDMEARGELSYLPFRLSEAPLSEGLRDFDRIKHMIRILPDGREGFFRFLLQTAERRFALPTEESMKFAKSDFEGWAVL